MPERRVGQLQRDKLVVQRLAAVLPGFDLGNYAGPRTAAWISKLSPAFGSATENSARTVVPS